jgi:hypothetical protein
MLKSLGRFHSLVVPLLTWLVLLIPFAFYQRYYVTSQQAYLTEHGFRLLSAVGRQLNSYIDSVSKTVIAAQKTKGERGPVEQGYLREALPDLDIPPGDFEVPKEGSEAPSLSVEFGPPPPGFRRNFSAEFIGRLRLDNAIRQRLTGIGEDYFDDVLIADSQGQVLFQRSTDTRITKLDSLVRAAADNSGVAPATAKEPTINSFYSLSWCLPRKQGQKTVTGWCSAVCGVRSAWSLRALPFPTRRSSGSASSLSPPAVSHGLS